MYDNFTHECSFNNLKEHNEIFYLAYQFKIKYIVQKVNYYQKQMKWKNNLLANYQICLNSNICFLSHCEDFLDEILNKCDDFHDKQWIDKNWRKKEIVWAWKKNILNTYNKEINSLKNSNANQWELIDNKSKKEKLKKRNRFFNRINW